MFSVTDGTVPEVSLTEEAEQGRANRQLRQKLQEVTGEKPGIVSGTESSRKKLVFDMSEEDIRERISEFNSRTG